MAERRNCQVYGNVESSINELVNEVTSSLGIPVSVYVRRLIINDLTARGRLNTELLLAIIS